MESGGKGVDLEQWSRHAEWGEGRRSRTVELTSKLCAGAFIQSLRYFTSRRFTSQ